MSTGVITLVSGVPGSGKSLWLVSRAVEGAGSGLRVFTVGIPWVGVPPRGVVVLDNVGQWLDSAVVPDGSVVIVDEADLPGRFPQRSGRDAAPEYIAELRRVRHRGITLYVGTQHPKQVDVAVRRLVGVHVHLERLFGMEVSQSFSWAKVQERPEDRGARYGATKSRFVFPSEFFPLYSSASVHTVKRRVPFRILFIPVAALVLVGLLWLGWYALSGMTEGGDSVPVDLVGGGVGVVAGVAPVVPSVVAPAGSGDYLERFVPRVPTKPWSAPAWDGRAVVSSPVIACIAVDDGRCMCRTEQGTRYRLDILSCRTIARDGNYNPFLAEVSNERSSGGESERGGRVGGSGGSGGSVSVGVGSVGGVKH